MLPRLRSNAPAPVGVVVVSRVYEVLGLLTLALLLGCRQPPAELVLPSGAEPTDDRSAKLIAEAPLFSVVIEPGVHVELHAHALSYGMSWTFEVEVAIVNLTAVALIRHSPDLVTTMGIHLVTSSDKRHWGESCLWSSHWSKALDVGERLEGRIIVLTGLEPSSSAEIDLWLCPLATSSFGGEYHPVARLRAIVDPHGQLTAFELVRHDERP